MENAQHLNLWRKIDLRKTMLKQCTMELKLSLSQELEFCKLFQIAFKKVTAMMDLN